MLVDLSMVDWMIGVDFHESAKRRSPAGLALLQNVSFAAPVVSQALTEIDERQVRQRDMCNRGRLCLVEKYFKEHTCSLSHDIGSDPPASEHVITLMGELVRYLALWNLVSAPYFAKQEIP